MHINPINSINPVQNNYKTGLKQQRKNISFKDGDFVPALPLYTYSDAMGELVKKGYKLLPSPSNEEAYKHLYGEIKRDYDLKLINKTAIFDGKPYNFNDKTMRYYNYYSNDLHCRLERFPMGKDEFADLCADFWNNYGKREDLKKNKKEYIKNYLVNIRNMYKPNFFESIVVIKGISSNFDKVKHYFDCYGVLDAVITNFFITKSHCLR